jgi:hypothetical protein
MTCVAAGVAAGVAALRRYPPHLSLLKAHSSEDALSTVTPTSVSVLRLRQD